MEELLASIGSPSEVPVPCISRLLMSPGAPFAEANVARITACWLGPFGACHRVSVNILDELMLRASVSAASICFEPDTAWY